MEVELAKDVKEKIEAIKSLHPSDGFGIPSELLDLLFRIERAKREKIQELFEKAEAIIVQGKTIKSVQITWQDVVSS